MYKALVGRRDKKFKADKLETSTLKTPDDLSDKPPLDAIRLYDHKSALLMHLPLLIGCDFSFHSDAESIVQKMA